MSDLLLDNRISLYYNYIACYKIGHTCHVSDNVEDFAQENGVDGFEMTEDGYAGNPDAVTGATFHVMYFLDALQDALNR